VPARIVCGLPDNFSFPEAAMLEAVSGALHGVAVAEMIGDETVL
jgi:L-iditol 2-dehydrogenase